MADEPENPTQPEPRQPTDGHVDRAKQRALGVDQAIREAITRGDFDNLPGKGKPLEWSTERDDEWWLANHMLQGAGYKPAFIETDEAIRTERAALAKLLADHVAWHRAHAAEEPPEALRRAADAVVARFRERAAKLNREIDSHNFSVPIESMQRGRVRVDADLAEFYRRLGMEPEQRSP